MSIKTWHMLISVFSFGNADVSPVFNILEPVLINF